MKPHTFLGGCGCRKCAYAKARVKKTKPFEYFLAHLPKKYEGYTFTDYHGMSGPITATCPKCGRTHKYATANAFNTGIAGCRSCNSSLRHTDKDLADMCKLAGFTLISRLAPRQSGKYMVSQVKVKCDACGKVSKRNVSNLSRSGCKHCARQHSNVELELFSWVKSMCPDAESSVRGVISKELDIYIPSLKVAIEFNGTYWHCERYKPRGYHSGKSFECKEKGIRLIHVWEFEWANPQQRFVLENIILGALKKLPERHYARECEVYTYIQSSPRWTELNQFFAENNIQGNRGGSIIYTLEKEGKVLMAYKFGRPSGGKAKKKYQWEMVRGASAHGVQVVGGATKLWKHFINEVKPKSVVYYVDFNAFDGCSVEKLGGQYSGHTESYKNLWVHKGVVKNREPRRHKEMKALAEKGDIVKIWNAGVLKYEFFF